TNPIPTPFVYKDNVYASSGFRGAALFAIPLDSKGDITGTDKIAWSLTKNTPYIPSPLLVKDRIYFTKDRNPIMTCVNADTGEIILPAARLPELLGVMYSSPAAVGENVFFTTRDGKTLVVKVGEETKPLSVNKLDDEIDASPVIVGDSLFMRGKDYLYCIAEG
ncbi:PQQ-like beta-propeller repeat protein, partial [bacterium]|nr:PQQ-like beta-propeller repeat protein [bacterium]